MMRSFTTWSAGATIVFDRDRAVRIAEEPVELVPFTLMVVSSAAAAFGASAMPGSL